ncbi:MAG: hypothetical protein JNL58_26400 [Planctomyces sp.]|nr:hypothetical protein [Planctomyces sp.]
MAHSLDLKQQNDAAIEPCLLDYASKAFLAGDRRGIRSRFCLRRELPLVILAGVALMFLSIAVVQQVLALNNPVDTQPSGQGLLITMALLIGCLYFIIWKVKADSTRERLVNDGQVLTGSVVRCCGKMTSNGEESWYSVKIEYRFLSPQQCEIMNHWERDRDDLANLPLPTEGTAVLVLYLDDNCYALL